MSEMSDDDYYDQDEEMYEDDDDIILSSSPGSPTSVSSSGFGTHQPPSPTLANQNKGKGKQVHATDNFGVEFEAVSVSDLMDKQTKAIKNLEEMLGLKASDAATLLRFFAWKKDKLVDAYMDDSDRVLSKAGIHEGGSQPRLKRVRGFVCDVCYDEDGQKETIALSCDHRFCKECYSQYVSSKITDEAESRRIQCMGSKCNVIVDEKTVQLLVEDDVFQRYRDLLNRTYVDDTASLRWCPAPECEYAIACPVPARALDVVVPTVTCACGHTFCFGCGEAGDHRPCCCPIVKRWMKKCADDSETSNWISANTKECTKCHSTIEKNGGCNHMTCKKCKWEFCWVCMGPWSEHGTAWYNCSRYDDKAADKGGAQDAQSKSRASLERYLHYYNRFANHEQSMKLENELYARTEKKMDEIQEHSNLSWIEVQFLAKAVETLGRCRTVLKWTYAMAFYLAKNNQTQMFEDNQNDLEQAVESLSELLEAPLEEDKIAEIRAKTTDKTVYVARRCQILLEDTLRGYDEERWIWQDPIVM